MNTNEDLLQAFYDLQKSVNNLSASILMLKDEIDNELKPNLKNLNDGLYFNMVKTNEIIRYLNGYTDRVPEQINLNS